METRKLESVLRLLRAFQWSHGFSTMETSCGDGVYVVRICVSMEPRFFNHGDQVATKVFRAGAFVSMEPRFFNHGDPPRFLRISSWASGGDFEHLLTSLQKLYDFGAAARVTPRVAAVSRCEHLPGFRPVLRCSKMASYVIWCFCGGVRRCSCTDNSRASQLSLLRPTVLGLRIVGLRCVVLGCRLGVSLPSGHGR